MLSKRTRRSLDLGTLLAPTRFGQGRCLPYADRSHGGRSSARLERQVVALEVGGSSPLGHPKARRPTALVLEAAGQLQNCPVDPGRQDNMRL